VNSPASAAFSNVTSAEDICKFGFRRWYERQFIVQSGRLPAGADAEPVPWLKVRCRKRAHQ
jgi:hypothetical protein